MKSFLVAIIAALSLPLMAYAQVPAGAPAGSTGICKDGSYSTGPNKQGACRGHKGVKTWYGGTVAAAPSAPSTPAQSMKATPVATGPAPAGSTGLCKDGSYWTGPNKRGACKGHKGVQTWYASTTAPATAPMTGSTKPAPTTAAPTQTMVAPQVAPTKTVAHAPVANATPAPGGGNGQVWVNTASKVYHCPGSRYYGTTKAGSYMTEQAAIAAGDRADHGKACH